MKFQRSSGILLHPTSLPGPYGSGDLGQAAYHFIDWLVVAGQKLWQMLPLGPVGYGNSPYMGLSAFAGNPMLIDLQELSTRGWLDPRELAKVPDGNPQRIDYARMIQFRSEKLLIASNGFFTHATDSEGKAYEHFCKEHANWLEDYAFFMALNSRFGNKVWSEWDTAIAHRKPAALQKAKSSLTNEIDFHKFAQWCFMRQWKNLRNYANKKGILLVGDIPIFVAHDSADVWSNPGSFYLGNDLNPTFVAGVPPDYFSETGQRWGNPLYKWDVMKKDKYAWWIKRFQATFDLVDILRIDHFRGFVGYWEIPATEKTAVKGRWADGPRAALFDAVEKKLGKLPIIAEDLGLITPEVVALRDHFQFPGMKVLQFAFSDGPANAFLPHHYHENSVVYTGTHDNDTTVGWFKTATIAERSLLAKYVGTAGREIHWDLIRLALQSVALMSILPFQDILGLDTTSRMNLPGTTKGNWEWRFSWDQVRPEHAKRLYEETAIASRTSPDRLDLPT
jgi:4-alpha-glucanotransferase